MKSIEITAKTVEEALAQGLEQLGASLADVSYEVVEAGKKGLLGMIGSKAAVVRITMNDEPAIEEIFSSVSEPEAPAEERAAAKTMRAHKASSVKQKAEAAKETVKERLEAEKTEKPEKAPKVEKASKTEKAPKNEKTPKIEKPAEALKEETVPEVKPDTDMKPAKAEDFAEDTVEYKAISFLSELVRLMGVKVDIYPVKDEEGNLRLNMFGDTLGILIGRRGETLDALQYLTSLYVNHGSDHYIRVTLDNENYRAKREEALRRLANRMANRAIKTGRKVVMEPMNPYERRILHSALQQNDAVTTHSEGEEPNRHVVITLKNDK